MKKKQARLKRRTIISRGWVILGVLCVIGIILVSTVKKTVWSETYTHTLLWTHSHPFSRQKLSLPDKKPRALAARTHNNQEDPEIQFEFYDTLPDMKM